MARLPCQAWLTHRFAGWVIQDWPCRGSGSAATTSGCGSTSRQAGPVVGAALDAGITLFDTSDSYGASEEFLGELLEGKRDDVILATKFGSSVRGANGTDWDARGSRRYIRRAVERSLRRLRTDYIDLYQLHKPDPQTPIEETLAALTELVNEGKVRYIGCSNFSGFQVAHAEWQATHPRLRALHLGAERLQPAQP